MTTKRERGLNEKYYVARLDGADERSDDKHFKCDYFVLDLTHDPHAIPAIRAYAESAERDGYQALAADLFAKVGRA